MTLLLFLKPAHAPPKRGVILGDTEHSRKERSRQKRVEEEYKEEKKKLRAQLKQAKKAKVAKEEAPVDIVSEIPLFQSVPFDLRGYVEDLMRAAILRMKRIRNTWLYAQIMFGDDDD